MTTSFSISTQHTLVVKTSNPAERCSRRIRGVKSSVGGISSVALPSLTANCRASMMLMDALMKLRLWDGKHLGTSRGTRSCRPVVRRRIRELFVQFWDILPDGGLVFNGRHSCRVLDRERGAAACFPNVDVCLTDAVDACVERPARIDGIFGGQIFIKLEAVRFQRGLL